MQGGTQITTNRGVVTLVAEDSGLGIYFGTLTKPTVEAVLSLQVTTIIL